LDAAPLCHRVSRAAVAMADRNPREVFVGSRTGPTLITTADALCWAERVKQEEASAAKLSRSIQRASERASRPVLNVNKPYLTGMPATTLSASWAKLKTAQQRELATVSYQSSHGSWPKLGKRYPNVDDVLALARSAQPIAPSKGLTPWR